MFGLTLLVLSIGLADSLNPSTVGPALYMATDRAGTRRVAAFTAGVVAVNLVGGIVLTFGPGRLLLGVIPHPSARVTHRIELAAGGVLLLLSVALWFQRARLARHMHQHRRRVAGSTAFLGAAIAAIELPTAFPYFAVIAAVISSGRSVLTQLVLLVLFNICFVLPLCAIVVLRAVAGTKADRLLPRIHEAVQRAAPTLISILVAVIGVALVGAGALGVGT